MLRIQCLPSEFQEGLSVFGGGDPVLRYWGWSFLLPCWVSCIYLLLLPFPRLLTYRSFPSGRFATTFSLHQSYRGPSQGKSIWMSPFLVSLHVCLFWICLPWDPGLFLFTSSVWKLFCTVQSVLLSSSSWAPKGIGKCLDRLSEPSFHCPPTVGFDHFFQ